MATWRLSRGILSPNLLPLTRSRLCLIKTRLPLPLRPFATSQSCRAAARSQPKITIQPSTPSPGSAQPKGAAALSQYAFLKSLSSKPTPTTLYEAPSHFWFYFGCWTSGLSILAWTAVTGPGAVLQPDGVPEWVGYVFGASYLLLGSMGLYLITKTPRIVASIRMLPAPASTVSASALVGSAAAGSVTQAPRIEVRVKRMVPFMQPKVIVTSLQNTTLRSRFSLPTEYVPELKRQQLQRIEVQRQQQLWRFDKENLLTMPFRRLWRGCASLFTGVKYAWTDMGFGMIKVDGKVYKVDVTRGFAHDGFRTLERLVPIEP